VRAHPGEFDVLMVDGYDFTGLPGALSSRRFYEDACSSLRPSGVIVANLHVSNPEFPLLVQKINGSFNSVALVVKERDEGNSIVFARKDCPLTSGPIESVARLGSLDDEQWTLLQAAFARIRSARSRLSRVSLDSSSARLGAGLQRS
jgi:spermidine synthase